MIFGILAVILLGIFGFLEWAIGTILLMFLDGLICSIIELANHNSDKLYNEQLIIHSGIITDYISIDISIVWFVGLIICRLFKNK